MEYFLGDKIEFEHEGTKYLLENFDEFKWYLLKWEMDDYEEGYGFFETDIDFKIFNGAEESDIIDRAKKEIEIERKKNEDSKAKR